MIISGRLKSVSDTWKKPIINGSYMICSLSVTMESATRGIVDAKNVLGGSNDPVTLKNPESMFVPPEI